MFSLFRFKTDNRVLGAVVAGESPVSSSCPPSIQAPSSLDPGTAIVNPGAAIVPPVPGTVKNTARSGNSRFTSDIGTMSGK